VRRIALLVCLAACAAEPAAQQTPGVGPNPALPAPDTSLIPTLEIAPAERWSDGEKPHAAPGFRVERFAAGLEHPRWLYVLPNGDVLVAETNAPKGETAGLRG
jgi:glucose/arabinose dehydrogenase